MRFFRSSGLDLSSLPEAEEGVSVERNRAFRKCIEECVVSELLNFIFYCWSWDFYISALR